MPSFLSFFRVVGRQRAHLSLEVYTVSSGGPTKNKKLRILIRVRRNCIDISSSGPIAESAGSLFTLVSSTQTVDGEMNCTAE